MFLTSNPRRTYYILGIITIEDMLKVVVQLLNTFVCLIVLYIIDEGGLMVFNATFNNISVISWRSILLVEETGVPRKTRRLAASHWQTLSHIVVSTFVIRRVWRYQRGNQNPYIEEEQTTPWPKEKIQKDKQRSTKHTYKTKGRVTRTPVKTGGELPVLRKGKQFLFH